MKPYAKLFTVLLIIIFAIAILVAIMSFFKFLPILTNSQVDEDSVDGFVLVVVTDLEAKNLTIDNLYFIYVDTNDSLTIVAEQYHEDDPSDSITGRDYRSISALERSVNALRRNDEYPTTILLDQSVITQINSLYENYKKAPDGIYQVNFCEILSLLSDADWQEVFTLSPAHLQTRQPDSLPRYLQAMKQAEQCYFEIN